MSERPAPWLQPLHRLVWADPRRRSRKLLQFAEVEAEGARDLFRAAEVTDDPTLRRRFFAHARDEVRHAALFRERGLALRRTLAVPGRERGWGDAMLPGERGLDDLVVERENATSLLAFIHLSESAASRAFAAYAAALEQDAETQQVIERIARDEVGHMHYSRAELGRVAQGRTRGALWRARMRRLWRAYLRLATKLADGIATLILTALYFILVPPFALAARRGAKLDRPGWHSCPAESADHSLRGEYG